MDALEVIMAEKMCLYMEEGSSWTTPSGVVFSKEFPYRVVDRDEAINLLNLRERKFRIATKEEVAKFYEVDIES